MRRAYAARELAEIMSCERTTIVKRAQKESWQYTETVGRGGRQKQYQLSSLPGDIQKAIVEQSESVDTDIMLPSLSPEAELIALRKRTGHILPTGFADGLSPSTSSKSREPGPWEDPKGALRETDLEQVGPWVRIIEEARNVPPGWKKRAWIETVALRHETTFQTIYRKLNIYEKKGIVGLTHRKSTRGTPRDWTPEALDFWIGLVLKRTHRKIAKDSLYKCLQIEAHQRGWRIGSYRSALWWLEKKITPQLLALQKGGVRALDNTLPPILRDYSDLAPFEILVGDQHRFDFWVTDDETGEVFRPECYMWQDLRTRLIYGAAIDHKYDAMLIGLALRIGIRIFGAFKNIYTDNGRPELSRYIVGVMKDMRTLGLNVEPETEYPLDTAGADPEEIHPVVTVPGNHRKAIVKNAKAKMIEGTFSVLEGIMRDVFKLPGYVKNLKAGSDEQDIDQKEAQRLALQGRLPTFREFALAMYRALDYYNREKPHRGALREWRWKPKPKAVTPLQCLEMCCNDGWAPRRLSEETVDLVFMAKAKRIVDRGRVALLGKKFEADALMPFNGRSVALRYDPLATDEVLVFYENEYLCTALTTEYSSMKDRDLADRKIEEKLTRRKRFAEEYRRITSGVPDLRQYSKITPLEKAAAVVGSDKRKRREEREELYRTRSPEELEREVAAQEEREVKPTRRNPRAIPQRPAYFLKDLDRYEWIVRFELAGGTLAEEDLQFKTMHEARMPADQREYWETVRECGLQP